MSVLCESFASPLSAPKAICARSPFLSVHAPCSMLTTSMGCPKGRVQMLAPPRAAVRDGAEDHGRCSMPFNHGRRTAPERTRRVYTEQIATGIAINSANLLFQLLSTPVRCEILSATSIYFTLAPYIAEVVQEPSNHKQVESRPCSSKKSKYMAS